MKEIRTRGCELDKRDCQCPTCLRVFTGLKGFDKHRKKGVCVDPSTLGFRLDWKGRWTAGSGLKQQVPASFKERV